MSIKTTVHHIDDGAKEMYPVDAASATGNHPYEWSRVPWTDEMRAAARPKLEERAKRQADEQEAAQKKGGTSFIAGQNVLGPQVALGPQLTADGGGQTGDKKTDAEIAKRLQGDVDAAQADLDKAGSDLDAAKGRGDDKAVSKAQGAVDQAKARRDEAQAKLDAAKK